MFSPKPYGSDQERGEGYKKNWDYQKFYDDTEFRLKERYTELNSTILSKNEKRELMHKICITKRSDLFKFAPENWYLEK